MQAAKPSTPETGSIPAHIAIIMDGNGRWAKARHLPRTAGHKKGADAVREVMEACEEKGVRYLTLYAFSEENWRRPPEEVDDLMSLLRIYLRQELKALHRRGVKIQVIGDRTKLAQDIQVEITKAETMTAENKALHVIIALSYGSRQEVTHAARQLAKKAARQEIDPAQIDEKMLEDQMYTVGLPEPDLLIRTGGEKRLSNFLLWQLAYTELYFTEAFWPDFTKNDLFKAIEDFTRRERRYGTA